MDTMEEMAKRFTDIIIKYWETVEAVGNKLEASSKEEVLQFFKYVEFEMKTRGVEEGLIQNTLKAAQWGASNYEEIERQVRESPSILDDQIDNTP